VKGRVPCGAPAALRSPRARGQTPAYAETMRMGVLAACVALASVSAAQTPRPPATSPSPDRSAGVATPPAFAEYEIGARDILRVTVYGHEDLTQTVLVQADGTFTFPLIGTVQAAGMTPLALEHEITTLLARGYIRKPQVTVVVEEYRSKTVFVVGEVTHPGTYPLAGKSTSLVEVLARAGPMTPSAGAEVIVVRPRPGANVSGPVLPFEAAEEGAAAPGKQPADVLRINLRDIQAGQLQKNIELRSNDTVFVPEAPKVFVSGEVRNPGAYAWFPGMSARQLISVAGGLTPEGSDGRLKVARKQGSETREESIKKDDEVQPGDTLVVRRRLF
jgi:polysaccharide export outer membrane protein